MLREALELLQQTAEQAAGAKNTAHVIPELPGRPEHYGIVANGVLNERAKDPPARRHTLGSVADVVEYAKYAQVKREADPVIWLSPTAVQVVLNDGTHSHRRDVAVCPLKFTGEVEYLQDAPWSDQKEMLRLFRNLLWDALGDNAKQLVSLFRAMTFHTSTAGHGNIEAGRASYGADIASEVKAAAGELSQFERLTLKVRIFDDPALKSRRPVLCVLDDDPQQKAFTITPLGASLSDAIDDELSHVEDILQDAGCPVFLGQA